MTISEALKRMGECVHMVRASPVTSEFSFQLDTEAIELLRGLLIPELKPPTATLNVEQFVERRQLYSETGKAMLRKAEDFRHCTHKNADGSDARFSAGSNGELLCVCGNRWD